MGFWKRLIGGEAESPVRSAVVGEGLEAGRLAAACHSCSGIELVGAEVIKDGDGVIRMPQVRAAGLDRFDSLIRERGLEAVEIVAPLETRAGLAAASIKAGLFTSVEAPASVSELEELEGLSRSYRVPLRIRMLPFYYPPYQEAKRLLDENALGMPMSLKLMVRRGKGSDFPRPLDAGRWLLEKEAGFIALGPWLLGPIEKVHARLARERASGAPGSSVVMWKHVDMHRYGYLQLDLCPELHVRTFTDPVHRFIEVTSVGGLILATRGEGQMLRMPALIVRGKSTTTSFELVPDEWTETYANLARETVAIVRKGRRPRAGPADALAALRLIEAAESSAASGDEVACC